MVVGGGRHLVSVCAGRVSVSRSVHAVTVCAAERDPARPVEQRSGAADATVLLRVDRRLLPVRARLPRRLGTRARDPAQLAGTVAAVHATHAESGPDLTLSRELASR